MTHDLRSALLGGIASVGLIFGAQEQAQSAYFVDIQQIGDDVVAIGVGSIDYTALTPQGFSLIGGPRIQANQARLFLTPSGTFSTVMLFSGISGPDNFGIGAQVTTNISLSPLPVAINGSTGFLALPAIYSSGTPLPLNTVVWDSVFFEDLDIVEGTYVWEWGSGSTFDTFTIKIGSGISPPDPPLPPGPPTRVMEPTTLALLSVSLLGLGVACRSRRGVE